MKTTAIMTTYNGTKYLIPQMDSLRDQTLPFDEVIIMDDHSSDGTSELVSKYIAENGLKNWKLIRNRTNQGWKKNFKLGFEKASGDYIFPCDQDDVWNLNKAEIMVETMEREQWIDVLASDYTVLLEGESSTSGYARISRYCNKENYLEKISFDAKWPYVRRPGCTFCFRRSFYDELSRNWNTEYAHDAILWRNAIIRETLAILHSNLISFRRHCTNATSGIKFTTKTKIEELKMAEEIITEMQRVELVRMDEQKWHILQEWLKFLHLRMRFFQTKNMFLWISVQIKYRNYYLFWTNGLNDLKLAYRSGE